MNSCYHCHESQQDIQEDEYMKGIPTSFSSKPIDATIVRIHSMSTNSSFLLTVFTHTWICKCWVNKESLSVLLFTCLPFSLLSPTYLTCTCGAIYAQTNKLIITVDSDYPAAARLAVPRTNPGRKTKLLCNDYITENSGLVMIGLTIYLFTKVPNNSYLIFPWFHIYLYIAHFTDKKQAW